MTHSHGAHPHHDRLPQDQPLADEQLFTSHFTRRGFLNTAAAVSGGALAAGVLGGRAAQASASSPDPTPSTAAPADPDVPAVTGVHLQFGADAASEVVVSWHTLRSVRQPRVLLGRPDGTYLRSIAADTRTYTDAKSGQVVFAHHARVRGLHAEHHYAYAAVHAGAEPELATFRMGPSGRRRFSFTSFGDQGTPTLGKKYAPPAGVTIANPPYVNDNLGSPTASDTTLGVERLQPLLHLFNGDLCYANLAEDRVRTWSDFWTNNTRSAKNRPWMPAPGNHENELGNGPIGYQAYQTYFEVPSASGQTELTRGLWYAFTAGSVRFISLANDDICLQDGGNSYVRGYSRGAQKKWLESELRATRSNRDIDWIVVCMHQVAISTVDQFNGADLGIRSEWLPLFDKYEVDLVVCGHEHHYERSHPIRGRQPNETLTPIPTSKRTDRVDTSTGTVHMVIGGGGTSSPSNQLFYDPPACRVIVAVAPERDPATNKRTPTYVKEPAAWSAVRDAANAYGFAEFVVDPGTLAGGMTSIEVTYYDIVGTEGQVRPFETFTLTRPRSDRRRSS